jgi:hypothetical protein
MKPTQAALQLGNGRGQQRVIIAVQPPAVQPHLHPPNQASLFQAHRVRPRSVDRNAAGTANPFASLADGVLNPLGLRALPARGTGS